MVHGHHAHAGGSLNSIAFSATVHCLTGCAIGEVLGMVIGTALGWGNVATIVLAVCLAFLFGYGLTMLPLLRGGMAFGSVNYSAILPRINEVAVEHGMVMPREFVLITKQFLYFDRYAKLLAPELNVFTDPRLLLSLMQDIQKARAQRIASP